VSSGSSPIGCDGGTALEAVIRRAPVTVVVIRRVAAAELFPNDLGEALAVLPYDVRAAVATPAAAAAAGVARPQLGEVLVFARESLLARLPDTVDSSAGRLLAVLKAGTSPWLAADAAAWERDDTGRFTISARGLQARFASAAPARPAEPGGSADSSESWEQLRADPGDRRGRA
jgi:hypothetical protein